MFALVTGSSGFVGPYLVAELGRRGHRVIELPVHLDVADRGALGEAVASFVAGVPAGQDAVVFHLAALSHVGRSWSDPSSVIRVNVGGTANLLSALNEAGYGGRFLFVSSAEVYGNQPGIESIPETAQPAPLSPYAATKLAGEEFVMQARRAWGADVVIARPFNHIGPRQSPDFLVSALARRIIAAERSGESAIEVGNLSAVRDFMDVRDVVRAYCELAERAPAGGVFNVASGQGVAVSELLSMMLELAGADLSAEVAQSLVRKVEVPRLVGDASKLRNTLAFKPVHGLSDTLAEVLGYWRNEAARVG